MTSTRQLVRAIQIGLLGLVGLMPFHAFATTWIGSLIGHRAIVQSWKEVLLVVLTLLVVRLMIVEPERRQRLKTVWAQAAGIFAVVGLLATVLALALHGISFTQAVYGAKIDLEFLVAAALAVTVTDAIFARRLIIIAGATGLAVAGFVVLQRFALPASFLEHFGYGTHTIKPFLYLTGNSGTIRYGGTLGGPNQLGAYLIIPICLAIAVIGQRQYRWWGLSLPVFAIALFESYSRSAWVGALVAGALVVVWTVPRRWRIPAAGGLVIAAVGAGITILTLLASHPALQQRILHASLQNHSSASSSDSEHLNSLIDGLGAVVQAPLGHGLGSAGPASFQTPHSNVIEDQFLQIGYETGWAGLGLIVVVLIGLVVALIRQPFQPWAGTIAATLIGISLAGFVIPTWDDSTTALIAFTLAGGLTGGLHVKPKTL